MIVECLKQSRGIIFGYEINVFSYHINMVCVTTLGEAQRVMRWRLIIKTFGLSTRYIALVYNIVADKISRFPYISVDKYMTSIANAQCCANKLFAIGKE